MKAGKGKNFTPSRQQLIDWINTTLHADLASIDELGSGCVFCELLNHVHPGTIQQSKINFQASNQYQFRNNFKLLQNAFIQLGIERHLAVQELVRAQYKDNFELAVWFYGYIGRQLPETDCTVSSQGHPHFDFSFARHGQVEPKYFTPRRCQRGGCSCGQCQKRAQRRLRQRMRELQTKFQMMGEVLGCGESPEDMCFLIQQIIDLSPG